MERRGMYTRTRYQDEAHQEERRQLGKDGGEAGIRSGTHGDERRQRHRKSQGKAMENGMGEAIDECDGRRRWTKAMGEGEDQARRRKKAIAIAIATATAKDESAGDGTMEKASRKGDQKGNSKEPGGDESEDKDEGEGRNG
ncbi:MAG: hypothetical protein Q9199_005973 [Rusavskia elegans]